jgi:tetrahydromethanopterin S-methyltransferase subunit G
MPDSVTREEFTHLEGRVSVVEQEVEGEKLVTRHILEQTRRNSDDLAAIKTRLDRVERKVDGVDNRMGSLDNRIGSLESNLPRIVGDVVREVFRERDERR